MANLFKSIKSFLILSVALLTFAPITYAAPNSIVAVDKDGVVGQYTSLVLDAQGYPTISYYDANEGKLKIMHCFEKNCAYLNTILTPDSGSQIGRYSSITLDQAGNPYVSYYDVTNGALKVLHCGTTTCSSGNTISTPDNTGNTGQYTAITLDVNHLPLVSYYDVTTGRLKILHCGNAACNSGNTIVTPDNTSSNGVQSSIKINSSGYPVVAYFDFTNSSLKLLRCGNVNCNAGNIISTLDSTGDVGRYPSLVLDSMGRPVISYLDLTNGKLKLIHCGNSACSAGNSITSIGASGVVGYFSSLALDANGNPVISYYDQTNSDLTIVHCGNANCTSGNAIFNPDSAGQVGQYTSLKLDANGNPVVSYFDITNGDLKVLHCGSASCNPNVVAIPDNAADVGRYSAIKLDSNNNPVVSYWDSTNGDLKLLHCGNGDCTAGNSITSPDTVGATGWDTSLALDSNGFPVVGIFDSTSGAMKVVHCINANCSGASSLVKPDVLSRRNPSIALDANGYPVIASSGQSDQGLRVVHCGDANCTNNNTITSPDFPAYPFNADIRGVSMVLDANGYPVVSFYRADKQQLKILHCIDAACNGPANSIAIIDPGAQASDHRSTSITLDASGYPVVAYQDSSIHALKVLHCGDANCTSGNNIATVISGGSVGSQPSIKLDSSGKPVVSYSSGNGLSVVHCGDANCTAGNMIVPADSSVTGAWDDALALDAADKPVVSYYDPTAKKLKVLRCGTVTCQ